MAIEERQVGVAASISDSLVRLHKEFYGKGPMRAKTYLVNDTVVCMLHGGFTTVERTLIDDGKADAVENVRRSFQQTMRRQFVEVVESATNRAVTAYMSQVHSNPDIAVELFVLEPRPEPLTDAHEAELVEAQAD